MPRIIMVDDNPLDREVMSLALKSLSFNGQYLEYEDGKRFLDDLSRGVAISKFDIPCTVVILDISMPQMDGLQILERLRALQCLQDLTIIMFSTSQRHTDQAAALAAGATDYFTKPMNLDDFEAIAAKIIDLLPEKHPGLS